MSEMIQARKICLETSLLQEKWGLVKQVYKTVLLPPAPEKQKTERERAAITTETTLTYAER